jgi:hypothetical protein
MNAPSMVANSLMVSSARRPRPALSRVREQLAQLARTCTNGFYWEGCRRSSGRAALGGVWRAMCDESACAVPRSIEGGFLVREPIPHSRSDNQSLFAFGAHGDSLGRHYMRDIYRCRTLLWWPTRPTGSAPLARTGVLSVEDAQSPSYGSGRAARCDDRRKHRPAAGYWPRQTPAGCAGC